MHATMIPRLHALKAATPGIQRYFSLKEDITAERSGAYL